MTKQRELSRDFDRLMAATTMFATQELERTVLGDDEDCDDAKQETHDVVSDVLDVVERSLDEDLLERLDRGEYPRAAHSWGCWPQYRYWSNLWPYYYGYKPYVARSRVVKTTRTEDSGMLDQIIDDFRSDIESKLKRARREERAVSDAELDESLKDLRDDLKLISRRSRRREDRREERREVTRAEPEQHSQRKG
jgi:hypothetical protein